jgi:hypothetical protein
MSKIRIYPVIHILNEQQVIRNVGFAKDAKADGVFLISHDSQSTVKDLIRLSLMVKGLIPWVGINLLQCSALEAMKVVPPWVDGLWTDNAEIDITKSQQPDALAIVTEKNRRKWPGAHFGGVAFKYQRPVDDVALAAKLAADYMDVITTSGPGTGRSADIDKIQKMREAIPPDARLAIASGITPENIKDYLPYATDFLVATGIGSDFYNLDPSKLQKLVEASGN